jgi:chromosome segregation ATPase
MNGLTPQQQKVIQTWTEERDNLLREIGNYTTELNTLKESTKAQADAFSDLQQSIAEANGRIAELSALEERMRTSLSTDVAELTARKSRLEAECIAKEDELNGSKREQGVVLGATTALIAANSTMKDQAAIVDSVVGQLIETSEKAISDVKVSMAEILAVTTEVIDKGNENISQTGIILEKLPRYIFELQKPIPVRRTYAAPPGTVIEPEQESPQ